jgi:enoyl-CoA hydratase/carnithine racemase
VSVAADPAMDPEVLLESLDEGRISAVALNRPAKRNAFSPSLARSFRTVLEQAVDDRSQVLLVRSATPGMFCAGFDISYIGTEQHEPAEADMLGSFAAIQAAGKVTIALADGPVFGGGSELFLSADLRLATPNATFRITPALLGVVYPYQGLSRFVAVLGITAAMELLMTARRIDADEAMRIGLVTRIVEDEAAGLEYCRQVASLAPLSQQAMKAIMKVAADKVAPLEATEAQWRAIQALSAAADASEDQQEGKRAFLEKRAPRFRGR